MVEVWLPMLPPMPMIDRHEGEQKDRFLQRHLEEADERTGHTAGRPG